MIFIHNFITLCKYLINNTIVFIGINSINSIYSIEFEYIDEDKDDKEEICYCNLCNTFRNITLLKNIILFTTRYLKYKKV
jgi:hypothetical protein